MNPAQQQAMANQLMSQPQQPPMPQQGAQPEAGMAPEQAMELLGQLGITPENLPMVMQAISVVTQAQGGPAPQ